MRASFGVDVCVGRNMLDDLADPEDRTKAKANLDRVFSTGQKLVTEATIGDPRLLRRHSRITHSPIFGDGGMVTGVVVLSRDITEQRMLEQKSEETELEFRTLFMLGPDAFYVASMHDGRIIEVNPGFETVFGYTREEVLGKTSRTQPLGGLCCQETNGWRTRDKRAIETRDSDPTQERRVPRLHDRNEVLRKWGNSMHRRNRPRHYRSEASGNSSQGKRATLQENV